MKHQRLFKWCLRWMTVSAVILCLSMVAMLEVGLTTNSIPTWMHAITGTSFILFFAPVFILLGVLTWEATSGID